MSDTGQPVTEDERIPVDDVSSIAGSLRGGLLVLFMVPAGVMTSEVVRMIETESYTTALGRLLTWCGLRDDLRMEVRGTDKDGRFILGVEALTERGRAIRTALQFANGEAVRLDA